MDELACRSFSSSIPQSLASFSGAGGQHPVLEFEYCDVPEQWLEDDDGVDKLWDGSTATALGNGATPSAPAAGNDVSDKPPAAPAPKWRRGRKPGPRTVGPVLSHVEAERQRRDKLNRRFCDLWAAVPTVSKMDRASLLADATAYIAELRAREERLEIEVKQQQAVAAAPSAAVTAGPPEAFKEKLEVRMLGQREAAALRLTTTAATTPTHAAARLMVALCSLDLPVQNACVCRVGGTTTVQDAVVDVPVALRDEGLLRAALLRCLQGSG
ncbi:unnamed protein product [Miscanthus lutarioriparius]|uniref:Transcription factor n=1 Tax=Miscanthus lutarioriparius TaxID=422564 RepID=A0A811PEE0_9POAL|nr:unnamed protein product [Miscanthus lutarioriparius]